MPIIPDPIEQPSKSGRMQRVKLAWSVKQERMRHGFRSRRNFARETTPSSAEWRRAVTLGLLTFLALRLFGSREGPTDELIAAAVFVAYLVLPRICRCLWHFATARRQLAERWVEDVTLERDEARKQLRPLLEAEQEAPRAQLVSQLDKAGEELGALYEAEARMPRSVLEQKVSDLEAELGRYHAAEEADREKAAKEERGRLFAEDLRARGSGASYGMKYLGTETAPATPEGLRKHAEQARLAYGHVADMVEQRGAEFGIADRADTVLFRVHGEVTLESIGDAHKRSGLAVSALARAVEAQSS